MSLNNKLFNYQKNIINKFKDRNSLGLFLDMGLGKTPLSLAFAEANKCNKIIIVTINAKTLEKESDKGSWQYWVKEIDNNFFIQTIKDKKLEFLEDRNECLICNYESLFKRKNIKVKAEISDNVNSFIKTIKNKKVALIIDESHKMKNSSSLQTIALFRIKKELELNKNDIFTYLLTGTPFTSEYLDLYTQLKMLGYNETKTYFVDKYCIRGNIAGLMGWQQPIVGYKNLNELYKEVHKYAITIKSDEVINLPQQIFIEHIVDSNVYFNYFTREKEKGINILRELKKRSITKDSYIYEKNKDIYITSPFYRNIDYPSTLFLADTSASFFIRAREISIGFVGNKDEFIWYSKKRLEELEKFLKNNEDNYVLFYNFTPELMEIFCICERLGYKIDVYCGEIKSLYFYNEYSNLKEEQKIVSKKRIIISNFASGSTGMNWQQYNKVILFSLPTFRDYSQSIKRVHRVGQKETVYYHIFYSNNWLDKKMIESLNNKKEYDEKLFEKDLKDDAGKEITDTSN